MFYAVKLLKIGQEIDRLKKNEIILCLVLQDKNIGLLLHPQSRNTHGVHNEIGSAHKKILKEIYPNSLVISFYDIEKITRKNNFTFFTSNFVSEINSITFASALTNESI